MMKLETLKADPLFIHDTMGLIPLELKSETQEDGKRHYQTPEGHWYPSITTILGAMSKDFINDWKDRIGHEEANRISGHAARRGNTIHKVYEDFLDNKVIQLRKLMPDIREIVKPTCALLQTHINRVVMKETALYSDALKIAGRTDLIADWDNKLSVVDHKGSGRAKERDWILGYFAQCTGYALMFKERYNIDIEQCVVVVSVEGGQPQVFVEQISDHIPYLLKAIENYNNGTGATT